MNDLPRLRRLEWLFARQPVYFVTACTANRRPILANEAIHRAFVAFATGGIERDVFVGRYVIMPDHLHMFVAIEPEGITLSTWMKSLKNHVSKEFRNRGVTAPH